MAAAHRSNALIAQLTEFVQQPAWPRGFHSDGASMPQCWRTRFFRGLARKSKGRIKTTFCVRPPFVLSGLSFSLLTFKATVIDSSVFEDTVYEGSVVGRGLVACDLTESLCTQSPLSTVVNHHALTIGFLTIGFFTIDFSTNAF